MTSIRAHILKKLAARLDAITDWSGQVRNKGNEDEADAKVFAIVAPSAEDKSITGGNTYGGQYRVSVLLIGRVENVDPVEHDGNPYLYLDSLVTALEQQMHAPDDWGLSPTFSDVAVEGHSVIDPEGDSSELSAAVFLLFKYQHRLEDPELPA